MSVKEIWVFAEQREGKLSGATLELLSQGQILAKKSGFSGIKLNTVLMRGINDDEAEDLVQFAIEQEIDISFIEEMPMGEVDHSRDSTCVSNDETLAGLQKSYTLIPSTENPGGPARYWRIPNSKTKVGFISPHTHNFCEACNRVRIT